MSDSEDEDVVPSEEELSQEEEDETREVEGRPGILYRYMRTVHIPILGLLDDTYLISESGFKAHLINKCIVQVRIYNSTAKNVKP